MLPPKSRPRHLPTLTHVVTSAELIATASISSPASDHSEPVDNEHRVQEIVQLLMPIVSARIRESLREILEQNSHQLEANMQREVESMVRRAMNECGTPSNG